MNPPERFERERLILRKPRMDDAPIIFEAYAQDPEVARYLVWRPHQQVEETQKFISYCLKSWQEESSFAYAITLKGSDVPIGMIEAHVHPQHFKVTLGYGLSRLHWGKGYMTEAVCVLVEWALSEPAIYRVEAFCDADNIGSARVMEKAGMEREGLLRRYVLHPNISDEPRDVYLYARVK
jgi:ribosomal-protein-alanine N-acetyltransferase